jgi:hypothetical protein
MRAIIVQKNGSEKEMEGSIKTYYSTIALTAAAQVGVKAFASVDGANGLLTNWKSSESRLPAGYIFNLLKLGFIIKNSDGSVLSPADLSKMVSGSFNFKIGEKEKWAGLLAEFFDSGVKLTDDTVDGHQEMPLRSFMPSLIEEGEWIYDDNFDFLLNLPAINTTMQLVVCMKGIEYKPIV